MMKAANLARFNQLYRSRQFEAILSQTSTALLTEEDHTEKLHLRSMEAMAHRRMGRLLESLEQSQDIWTEDPNQTLAESNINCIFMSLNNYSQISEFLNQKIVSNPTAWNYLFQSWFHSSNYLKEETLESLKSSLKVDPYFYEGNLAMASHFLDSFQVMEASRFINICGELGPGLAQTLWLRGKLLYRMNRIDEAISHFEKSLEIIPFFEDSVLQLADIYYFQKRDMDKVNALISGFREIQPLNPKIAMVYQHILNREEVSPLVEMKEIGEMFQMYTDIEPEVYSYTLIQMGYFFFNKNFEEAKALSNVLIALEDQAPFLKDFTRDLDISHL